MEPPRNRRESMHLAGLPAPRRTDPARPPEILSQHYRFRNSCDTTSQVKYRDVVREIALDHYGYVTSKETANAGVPLVELLKVAARRGIENIAYGLYRVSNIPPTPYDQYAEALLRVGPVAYLHGESVAALFA